MKRIWQIEEAVVEDPTTKLRVEFSSVHTDAVTSGEGAPSHDQVVKLIVHTSDRTRKATLWFERNGRFMYSEVEAVEQPQAGMGQLRDESLGNQAGAATGSLEETAPAGLAGSRSF